MKCYAKM
ncbi:Protein of unknown function [Pyronema omphalodes CBS 100304]|nr:Protein of unknown function [Pyronema omphalodes CBS 100304]